MLLGDESICAHFNLGRYQEALKAYEEALSISRQFGDLPTEGLVLGNIANVYSVLGEHEQALDHHQQALAISWEIERQEMESGTPHSEGEGTGIALNNIATVYQSLGRHELALDYLEHVLSIAHELGDWARECGALNSIGMAYYGLEQYEQASGYFQQALAINQQAGMEGVLLENIGAAHFELGLYQQALDYHHQALAAMRGVGARSGEGIVLSNIGFLYEHQGDVAQAIAFYEQAVDVLESVRAEIQIEELQASFVGG